MIRHRMLGNILDKVLRRRLCESQDRIGYPDPTVRLIIRYEQSLDINVLELRIFAAAVTVAAFVTVATGAV